MINAIIMTLAVIGAAALCAVVFCAAEMVRKGKKL